MSIDSRARQHGTVFGDWKIGEFLGEGSEGKTGVFRITRSANGLTEEYALKVVNIIEDIKPQRNYEEYLKVYEDEKVALCEQAMEEVKVMYKLQGSPNIVNYRNYTTSDWYEGNRFGCDLLIQMELLDTLENRQKQLDFFSEEEILQIGKSICNALIYCDKHEIIHRDIKPANIFINKQGIYLLGDFGISRIVDNSKRAITSIGTTPYMAPEQYFLGEEYDKLVDIYSLGLTLYELSNGNRLPFAQSHRVQKSEVYLRLWNKKQIPMPQHVNQSLAQVILKACAYRAEDRYQSAQEFWEALNNVKRGVSVPRTVLANGNSIVNREASLGTHGEDDPYATQRAESFGGGDKLSVNRTNNDFIIEQGVLTKYKGKNKEVIIPENITEIGRYAFADCTHLFEIVIPKGIKRIAASAFRGCTNLTSVVIPESVTEIGDDAFRACIQLTNVVIPVSLKMGLDVFRYTKANVAISKKATEIKAKAYQGCLSLPNITIPEGVTLIDEFAFDGCNNLTSITIPNGVKKIGKGAFSKCISLTHVVFPESITKIEAFAFKGCNNLTNITIPNGVKQIGVEAFGDCFRLTNVVIPDSVTEIGERAFYGSSLVLLYASQINSTRYEKIKRAITGVKIPDGELEIKDNAFSSCECLTKVDIPDGVARIGKNAFFNCENLTDVSIPRSVVSIDFKSFYGSGLRGVTIPQNVREVGYGAFGNCKHLMNVVIQDGVYRIYKYAFENCTNLISITIPKSVQWIEYTAFNNCPNLTIYTPKDSFAYRYAKANNIIVITI